MKRKITKSNKSKVILTGTTFGVMAGLPSGPVGAIVGGYGGTLIGMSLAKTIGKKRKEGGLKW